MKPIWMRAPRRRRRAGKTNSRCRVQKNAQGPQTSIDGPMRVAYAAGTLESVTRLERRFLRSRVRSWDGPETCGVVARPRRSLCVSYRRPNGFGKGRRGSAKTVPIDNGLHGYPRRRRGRSSTNRSRKRDRSPLPPWDPVGLPGAFFAPSPHPAPSRPAVPARPTIGPKTPPRPRPDRDRFG